MRAALVGLLLAAAGCANVQELGSTPPEPARPAPTSIATAPTAPTASSAPTVQALPKELGPCPRSAPVDGASCAQDVGWCHYRIDPAGGVAANCACSVDRRWTCLLARDDDRRNPLAPDAVPLTNASCTEGAPCAEGVRCTVSGASPRVCGCTSAGILLCTRPTQ